MTADNPTSCEIASGYRPPLQLSCSENLVETGRGAGNTFQVRVTQPIVVVHPDGTVAIAVLDQEFDGAAVPLCVSNCLLEALPGVGSAVDGDDLGTDGKRVLVRESFPHHVGQFVFSADDHAERVGQVRDFPASFGVLEIIGRRLRVDKFIAAAAKAIERCAGAVPFQPGAKKLLPLVRLNT